MNLNLGQPASSLQWFRLLCCLYHDRLNVIDILCRLNLPQCHTAHLASLLTYLFNEPVVWKLVLFFMFYFIFNELVFLCLLPLCVLVTGFMQLKHISLHIVGRAIVPPARSMNAVRWSRLWSQFSQLALPCNIICISRDCMFGMFANTVDCWLLRHHRYTLIDSLWGSADTRVG